MSVELDSLRLLIWIEELGSLGAASRELGVTQPAASARLRSLESRYGLSLVTRSPRGSRLTDDGRAVCTWAREVMTQVAHLEAGIVALGAERRGDLRVAASLTIAEYLIPRWFAELRQVLPQVHAGLNVVNSTEVLSQVRAGSVTLGFIESPAIIPDLRSRLVGNDRVAVVVPPEHPWARAADPVRRDELASTPLVVRETGSGTRETFDRALGAAPAIALEANSTSAVIGAARAGVGPAVVSEIAVGPAIRDGSLVDVAVALDLRRPLRAVWRSSIRLRSPATDLITIAAQSVR